MEKILFTILLTNGKKITRSNVTPNFLHKVVDNFINDDSYCLCITKAPSESRKIKIQKFYKSKYQFFTRQYKSDKITEEEYKKAINRLKEIKNDSETVEEFETKFNAYKKTLTIIPPYNVNVSNK